MKYINHVIPTTTYGKCLLLAFTVFLLAFGKVLPVQASETQETEVSEMSSDTVYTVSGIEHSEELSHLLPVEIEKRATSQDTEVLLNYIRDNGLETVNALITDSAGNSSAMDLTVAWYLDQTDVSVCGEYIITGMIRLPDASCGNYQWGEGVITTLSLTVIVTESREPVTITRIDSNEQDFSKTFALAQGADVGNFLSTVSLQQACDCYDAAGNVYSAPVIYHAEAVKTDTAGIYYITATFTPPLNCRFSDDLDIPTYSIPVSVQAPGHPRLDVPHIGAFSSICFPWVTSDEQCNTMQVWMSENEGDWRELELDWEVSVTTGELMLNSYAFFLTIGNSYQIQVKYEGGQTGIASFTYGENMLSDEKYIEGDRDGGDTDGNLPENTENQESTDTAVPDYSDDDENADSASSEESTGSTSYAGSSMTDNMVSIPAKEVTVILEDDGTHKADISEEVISESNVLASDTVNEVEAPALEKSEEPSFVEREEPYLLGSEITLMLENLGTARFSAEVIMLDIPRESIISLGISDTDRLLVTILPLENHGFSIDIFKNDVAVTEISSMQISMPYQPPEDTTQILVNESGKEVASGDYNPDTKLVTFTIHETGTFYIKDVKASGQASVSVQTLTATEVSSSGKDNDYSVFVLIMISAAAVICSAVAVLYIYKKKRRS